MAVHVALAPETIANIGSFPITNSMLTTWVVTIVLLIFAYFATRKITAVPQGLQNIAEIMIEGLQDLVSSIAPPNKGKVFMPIIATFFFFILFGNYLGLLPGVGSIGFWEESHETNANETSSPSADHQQPSNQTTKATDDEHNAPLNDERSTIHDTRTFVPYLRAINSDLNTTMALAILSVIMTHYLAIKYLGLGGYIGKFLSLNPIFLFVGLLELFGEFTKIASLSFRLFGNIFAGEVLLTTATTTLFAYIVPIPFYMLEFLVAFVQALIFAMLTLVFMVILTEKHTEGGH